MYFAYFCSLCKMRRAFLSSISFDSRERVRFCSPSHQDLVYIQVGISGVIPSLVEGRLDGMHHELKRKYQSPTTCSACVYAISMQ